MRILQKLFLEVGIKRKCNSWVADTFKSNPEIKSLMQKNAEYYFVMATVEFSLGNAC